MNYVGRLFSGVRGFYNEINPATLTGAIDVVVVRHSDGTFSTSPWHVRFGKMGVIRTRQKVVDIEINGEPVDLHMKLGEAGEAFFVQETEDVAEEVPAHLATSPIAPTLSEMEEGLAAMKLAGGNRNDADAITPVVEHSGSFVTMESGKVVVAGMPTSASTTTLVAMVDDRQYFSDSDMSGTSAVRRRRHATVATQTHITSSDISDSAKRPVTPPGEWYAGLSTTTSLTSSIGFESAASTSLPSTASNVTLSVADSSGSFPAPPALVNRIAKPTELPVMKTDVEKSAAVVKTTHEEYLFDMDLSDDEAVLPLVRPSMSTTTDISSTFGRCVSLPSIHQSVIFDEVTDSWASNQYTTTTMCNYTPNSSPFGSRPTSPQSDSGLMCLSQDAMSQTHLTGDRMIPHDDINWCWGQFPESASNTSPAIYGRHSVSIKTLKSLASEKSQRAQKSVQKLGFRTDPDEFGVSAGLPEQQDGCGGVVVLNLNLAAETVETKAEEIASSEVKGSCVIDLDAVKEKEFPDVSCPVVDSHILITEKHETVVETKKPTPKKPVLPEKDGIYLDDLTQDEPELAALYLYNHKRQSSPPQQQVMITKDEDSESGRGASLPQSPVTVENEPSSHDSSLFRPATKHPSGENASLPLNASVSLCGPLDDQEARVGDEKFNAHLVTFDALCDNPAIVNDPNLVIRVGDKFYNWAIAGPLLLSYGIFRKPLNDSSLSRLVSQHLPKKDTSSSRRGWRFWRRGGDATTQTNATTSSSIPVTNKDLNSPPSSHPSSPPDTPQKVKDASKTSTDANLLSDDEGETMTGTGMSSHDSSRFSDEPLGGATTVLTRDKCRKSLKLTSDQIEQLRLNEGVNEATFSVTTQYQGTTRCTCNIYLWNYDDRIVVSDIDGTITKSDVLGQVLPMIGSMLPLLNSDWSQAGIAQLYQMIHRNGYKFLYLSARAIGQSRLTRDYLRSVKQSDVSLPDGPLLLSPSSLMSAFHKEVIERKPEQFKISCLRDISALFPPTTNPFCGGFGNKINDVWAYREVGIPQSRIFTVNHKGELRMEMTQAFLSSYSRLSDLVDHMFPPLHQCEECAAARNTLPGANEYSSFTYWRSPLPDLDAELSGFIKARDAPAPTDKKPDAKKAAAAATAAKKAAAASAAAAPATTAKSKPPPVKAITKASK